MLNFEHQLLSIEAHGTSMEDNVPAKKIDRCRRVHVLLRLIDELASERKVSLRATLVTRQQHAGHLLEIQLKWIGRCSVVLERDVSPSAARRRLGSKQHDM